MAAAALRPQPDHPAARTALLHVADTMRARWPKLADFIIDSAADVLAYMTFPSQHRIKLHSTNPLERLNKEVKVIAHALLPPDGLPCGSPSLEARGQDGIGGNGIEVLWGEVFADPLLLIGIVGMVRIGQNFQEMLVAPGSAAIFWETGAFPGDAERIGLPVESGLGLFDRNRVFPVVAEVVGVGKAGHAGFQQTLQRQPMFVGDVIDGLSVAILPPGDVEGMEVAVIPAHRRLD